MGVITTGTNLASLKAQRQLATSSSQLSSIFEKLSSGLRINRASDDAAGLAISSSLDTSARVFSQGIRNLNDGLSALNIADSALESLSTIMIRLNELAVQAANGSLGLTQRKSLNAEARELAEEFFRISKSTEFNDRRLLDSSFGKLRLQGGFGVDGGIESGLGGAVGNGTFAARVTYNSPTFGGTVTGDFNNDGFLDIFKGDVLLGNGDGSFRAPAAVNMGAAGASEAIASDFNGDGILDLAVENQGLATVSVAFGIGDGTFKARTSYAVGANATSIKSGDFNGDGLIDLAASTASGVNVLLGTGNGSFAAATTFTAGSNTNGVDTGDFNGDGILDLALSDYDDSVVSVLLGNGNGSFKARTTYSTDINLYDVTSGDLNGDGSRDLVVVNYNGSGVSVLLGNGNGTFKARQNYTGLNTPRSAITGDVNGDGTLDIIAASSGGGGSLNVFLGNGDGTFKARTSHGVGGTTFSLASGDFDQNGVLDLVGAGIAAYSSIFMANTSEGVAPILPFSLEYQYEARQALPLLAAKLEQLTKQRGQIGAFQSRISVAINVLGAASENYIAASSQITSVEYGGRVFELSENSNIATSGFGSPGSSKPPALSGHHPAFRLN